MIVLHIPHNDLISIKANMLCTRAMEYPTLPNGKLSQLMLIVSMLDAYSHLDKNSRALCGQIFLWEGGIKRNYPVDKKEK